jgi:hypothetical protein
MHIVVVVVVVVVVLLECDGTEGVNGAYRRGIASRAIGTSAASWRQPFCNRRQCSVDVDRFCSETIGVPTAVAKNELSHFLCERQQSGCGSAADVAHQKQHRVEVSCKRTTIERLTANDKRKPVAEMNLGTYQRDRRESRLPSAHRRGILQRF